MKTKKINWLPLAAFTAVMVMAAVGFAGCKEDTPPYVPTEYTYSYPDFVAGTTMSFQPTGLPEGITYTVTSDTPVKAFTLGENGFNGTVNVNDGPYANFDTVTFTQTFSKDGKAVGSQTVKVYVITGKFTTLYDINDSEITKIPDVKLTY